MISLLLLHMNLRQLLESFEELPDHLYEKEEVRAIFHLCVLHQSGLNNSAVKLNWDRELSGEEERSYLEMIGALKTGRPIQHILGETVFYGLTFKVDPSVLIPRPETEELVEWILNTLKEKATGEMRIADFGTGSGCIAISLKKYLPDAHVDAIDISSDALKVAAENAAMNRTDVNFINADMREYHTSVKYSVMVSNPPYIRNLEKEEMHINVLEHEPHLALFVTDENPLIYYEALADLALKQLDENGCLFFEINEYLSEETIQMLSGKLFKNIVLKKDMQGKDRMIMASFH